MFKGLRAILSRLGPNEGEIRAAKAELISRATKAGLLYDAQDDYVALFASIRTEQAKPYIDAVNPSDPNYNQLIASILKGQLAGLRSRPATVTTTPTSRGEALDLIWEANQSDAVCAIEQLQIFATVKSVLQASIVAFLGLLGLQSFFASILGSIPLLDPAVGPWGTRWIKIGLLVTTNINNFFLSPYISASLIAVFGALFGIYLDLPQEGTTPHWRLVRKYSRMTRCWAGASAGLLTGALAPLIVPPSPPGSGQEASAAFGRIFVAAFLFGFSQELFLKKLQNLAGLDSKS
jgi:hypothetical protein